ncbi:M23 family metallopeptidase [Bernardetia litoralis]|uniref:M23 family metallopeptidase n=1 Tax=Bernardetia litoralis TaxID=999 RepID=UPI00030E5691|nr:M23 family metallopeptidase [Bernardetia litoralis]
MLHNTSKYHKALKFFSFFFILFTFLAQKNNVTAQNTQKDKNNQSDFKTITIPNLLILPTNTDTEKEKVSQKEEPKKDKKTDSLKLNLAISKTDSVDAFGISKSDIDSTLFMSTSKNKEIKTDSVKGMTSKTGKNTDVVNKNAPAIGGDSYEEENFRPANATLLNLSDTTMLRLSTLGGSWGYSLFLDTLAISMNARKSLFREDTSNYDNAKMSNIVLISEEIAIDCVWITMRQYYKVWNSNAVNPYGIDASKFRDTVQITLYDSAQNQYWSPPMASNKINSNFGYRRYRWHHGTDLDLDTGDPIYSVFDGIIRLKKYGRGFGNHIVVRHNNGLETVYAHLSATNVEIGDYVKAGQMIGKGGTTGRSTGPHLHFEIRYEGNSIDAATIFDFEKNEIKFKNFELTAANFKHLGARVNSTHTHTHDDDGDGDGDGDSDDTHTVRRVIYHKIKSGDSLWKISRQYGVTISSICKLNNMSTRSNLRLGRRLRIR